MIAFTGIANLGTGNSVSILFFQENNLKKQENLIWTNSILLFFTNILLLSLVIIFSENISQLVLKTDLYSKIIIISFLGLSLRVLSDPFMNYLRMTKQSFKYVLLNAFGTMIFVLLTIYHVIHLDQGLAGYVLAITLSHLISFIFVLLTVGFRISFDLTVAKILPLIKSWLSKYIWCFRIF